MGDCKANSITDCNSTDFNGVEYLYTEKCRVSIFDRVFIFDKMVESFASVQVYMGDYKATSPSDLYSIKCRDYTFSIGDMFNKISRLNRFHRCRFTWRIAIRGDHGLQLH